MIETEFPEARNKGIPIIASIGYLPEDLKILTQALERSSAVDAIEFSIHYVRIDSDSLQKMAQVIKEHTSLPVLAKLSPAVTDLNSVVHSLDSVVDGYVAINSLGPALDFNIETLKPVLGSENGRGWMSGRAILPIGLHFVDSISSMTNKPVLGVGGIRSVTDVIKYLMAGASAVQISSAAIIKGIKIYRKLAQDLQNWMDTHGYNTVSELTGIYRRRLKTDEYFLGEGPQLYPGIIYDNCKFCDICVKICMYDAIRFDEKKYMFNKDNCVSCGLCTTVCPHNALEMIEG
jgi:dihydroorotate dehydrogenase/NAD-dependent dihydropyrimidine dehydrogenase PreA subunit